MQQYVISWKYVGRTTEYKTVLDVIEDVLKCVGARLKEQGIERVTVSKR